MTKKRLMALDVGQKSCGIAWTDPLLITAQGRENFIFPNYDWQALITHLHQNYLSEVAKIIIGLPLLPSGDDSTTTTMIRNFASLLKQSTSIPVVFQEEYGSTKQARAMLKTAGLSTTKQKLVKDKLAAIIILQNYMEQH